MILRSRLVVTTLVGAVALVAIAGTASQASPTPRHSLSAHHHHAVGPSVRPALTSMGSSIAVKPGKPALRPTLTTNSGAGVAATARRVPTVASNIAAAPSSQAKPQRPTLTSNVGAGPAVQTKPLRPTLTSGSVGGAAYASFLILRFPPATAMHMTTMCGGDTHV
jgi:hypothetical protein